MDKLVAFFKNVWFRRALALISWAYTAFMVWIAWLSFAFFMEFEDPTPAFVLYVFINVAAMGLMILSRKQVLTQINSYVLPPIVFLVAFFGFGNWYLIIPPAVVMLVVFFTNTSNETLKTVLGTLALLLFVIGLAGRVGVTIFIGEISFIGPDLSERDPDYEVLSPSGEYRLVRYLDSSFDRSTMTYYVEYTGDDTELIKGLAKKVLGCQHVHTASYTDLNQDFVEWKTQIKNGKEIEVLLIDHMTVKENPYTAEAVGSSRGSAAFTSASSADPASGLIAGAASSSSSVSIPVDDVVGE